MPGNICKNRISKGTKINNDDNIDRHAQQFTQTGNMTEAGLRAANKAAIKLSNIKKQFHHVRAVQDLNLSINPGEVVALLGPNGAGKTTTIDIILGLSKPTTGEVSVFGMSPISAIRRGLVSAVMQNGGLLKDLTVRETVQYASRLFVRTRPIDEVMDRAGITDISSRLVAKCSGGEQQRLRFAMALLSDPELIVLDEPTQGMDVEGRHDFWKAIRHDASMGRTILFATHYLQEADSYADRIVLIRKGQVVADGTAIQIKGMTKGKIVRANLAHPDLDSIKNIAGVDSATVQGKGIVITCNDSDEVARYLLNKAGARDLEISSVGLEEAFLALTSDDARLENSEASDTGVPN